jgi:hypothetical protein
MLSVHGHGERVQLRFARSIRLPNAEEHTRPGLLAGRDTVDREIERIWCLQPPEFGIGDPFCMNGDANFFWSEACV